jgi:MFS family permease
MMAGERSSVALVLSFCLAETFSMAGFALVPSLLPQLSQQWALSATEGGWLGGIFFLGYVLAVPWLVSLTDRIDARRVYLAGAALSALAMAGFASFADNLLTGLCWWWLAGLGLAATYMPGLKALTDRLPITAQSRGTAFYTATFGVGAGLSYLWIELLQVLLPWPCVVRCRGDLRRAVGVARLVCSRSGPTKGIARDRTKPLARHRARSTYPRLLRWLFRSQLGALRLPGLARRLPDLDAGPHYRTPGRRCRD